MCEERGALYAVLDRLQLEREADRAPKATVPSPSAPPTATTRSSRSRPVLERLPRRVRAHPRAVSTQHEATTAVEEAACAREGQMARVPSKEAAPHVSGAPSRSYSSCNRALSTMLELCTAALVASHT